MGFAAGIGEGWKVSFIAGNYGEAEKGKGAGGSLCSKTGSQSE